MACNSILSVFFSCILVVVFSSLSKENISMGRVTLNLTLSLFKRKTWFVKRLFSATNPHVFFWNFSNYTFFYNRIKIQGLGSDMLQVTQNIGSKYAYDMLILCVQIFQMDAKRLFWSSTLFCLFWSSRP